MAFDLKGLKRIAQGPTYGTGRNSTISKWMYVTNDDLSTVTTAGYFNSLTSTNQSAVQMVKGDQIDMTLVIGGTALRYDFIVDSVSSTAITIKKSGAAGGGD